MIRSFGCAASIKHEGRTQDRSAFKQHRMSLWPTEQQTPSFWNIPRRKK